MCWLLLHQPVGDNSVYNNQQIKVNVFRIILDYGSSAFTRGILPFWNQENASSSQILKDPYWVFQSLFIIVCSWDPIMATLRALERLHFRCVSCRAKSSYLTVWKPRGKLGCAKKPSRSGREGGMGTKGRRKSTWARVSVILNLPWKSRHKRNWANVLV